VHLPPVLDRMRATPMFLELGDPISVYLLLVRSTLTVAAMVGLPIRHFS